MNILVTGAAGFIGMHLSEYLLREGHKVIGYDNMNNYYDIELKKDRANRLHEFNSFVFYKEDITNVEALNNCISTEKVEVIINLAAQAGVRYSIENPQTYISSNIQGFTNILEACKNFKIKHLIYASSSSVYGANTKKPFSTEDGVNHPVSLYAATKKSNELIAHAYSHLYDIPTTGLRFFTVYGTYGRPDMAYYSFAKNIMEGKTIKVFGNGEMMRDFTYIEDIVAGISELLKFPPNKNPNWDRGDPNPNSSYAPYKIYNMGNNNPVKLMEFIRLLEKHLGIVAKKEYLPIQPGDVKETFADIEDLKKTIDFNPSTNLDEGLKVFTEWFKEYYKIN